MKCLYCDKEIDSYSFRSMFIKNDPLCLKCRSALKVKRKKVQIEGISFETFFDYDGIFKSLLLQFKECYDEALAEVFLYELSDYIFMRYQGYRIAFIPSSEKKRQQRGFDHLEKIFKEVKLKKVHCFEMKEEITQEGKNLFERRKMITNYRYTGKPVKKLLIVDDVVTTGSSLIGAYTCAKPYAEKIKLLSLAYKNSSIQ